MIIQHTFTQGHSLSFTPNLWSNNAHNRCTQHAHVMHSEKISMPLICIQQTLQKLAHSIKNETND